MGPGTWSSPKSVTRAGQSGEFWYAKPQCAGDHIRFSHPLPFECAIRPRSEKSASLVDSIEF